MGMKTSSKITGDLRKQKERAGDGEEVGLCRAEGGLSTQYQHPVGRGLSTQQSVPSRQGLYKALSPCPQHFDYCFLAHNWLGPVSVNSGPSLVHRSLSCSRLSVIITPTSKHPVTLNISLFDIF